MILRLTVALFILSAVFWLLERIRPGVRSARRPVDTRVDVAYWYKNFAGLFPFIDLAFGTLYLPPGRQPERFGLVNGDVPDGLFRQLAYPFRRRSPRRAALPL